MVAPKKSTSAVNLTSGTVPEERISTNKMLPSSKSTESLYSTSSSKYSASALYKRRMNANGHGNGNQNRQSAFIPASTEVRQRVLSARRLRLKSLQNQLADALKHIADLTQENRMLQTMHKRQDSALAKYERSNAELPQLLHSHAEEVRIWQTKCRNLQAQNKEMAAKMKQKEMIILSISDQNRYLLQLTKNKNLEERQRLTDRVHQLENRLHEKDNDLKLMARRLQLESKSLKMQMQNEHKKYKFAMSKFDKARNELAVYTKLDELSMNDKLAKGSVNSHADTSETGPNPKAKDGMKPQMLKMIKDDPLLNKAESCMAENSNIGRIKNDENLNKSINQFCGTSKLQNDKFKFYDDKDDVSKAIQKSIESFGHMGQGDSNLDDQDDSDIDEIAKKILLSDDVEKETTKIKCPYLDRANDNDYDCHYEDDYEDDVDVDDDDDDNDGDVICSADNLVEKTSDSDIKNINKKITEDYKDREFYLDSYCRKPKPSNADPFKDTIAATTTTKTTTVDSKRKGKLLAALRAIDDDKKK